MSVEVRGLLLPFARFALTKLDTNAAMTIPFDRAREAVETSLTSGPLLVPGCWTLSCFRR